MKSIPCHLTETEFELLPLTISCSWNTQEQTFIKLMKNQERYVTDYERS